MGTIAGKVNDIWTRWAAYGMAAAFTIIFFTLISRQYATFHTRSADLDRFLQALWNTLHGRFMYSTIEERSVLSGHFSPILIVLAPLQLIWPDPRVFSLVQTVGFAIAGLFLFKIVSRKYPGIAPWFLLTYFLNPALHDVALLELRRITLAVPFLAMALYGLANKNRRLTAIGLFLALLCKEDVAIIVTMVGVYLLLFERDWRWGTLLIVFGIAWLAMVMFVINPLIDPKSVKAANRFEVYRGFNYYQRWGDSLPGILMGVLVSPGESVRYMFDAAAREALWRVFLPVGFILPLLAPSIFLLAIPLFGYMLLSGQPEMHRLEVWYMSPILPILFSAIAVGLTQRSRRQAQAIMGLLLITTLIGFSIYSRAPLGSRFEPSYYNVDDHERLAAEVVASVPPDAGIASTAAYTPQLAARQYLYLFPWFSEEKEQTIDYYLLDTRLNTYPLSDRDLGFAIDNLVADPQMVVVSEVDDIFLIRNGGEQLPSFPVNRVAESRIKLTRFEIAVADEDGWYRPQSDQPLSLQPGQELRVTLYWEALAEVGAERTVSVRIRDAAGTIVGQYDMQPNHGARPTSWWKPGWQLRDTYYLTIAPEIASGSGSLDVLLYDSYSQESVPFSGELASLSLLQIEFD